MSNTCVTCGQEVSENDTPLKMALKNSCNTKWNTGWDAVWSYWAVGDGKQIDGKWVTKVYESDIELDGYDTIPVEMVFEENDNYWKVSGSWSSYDGKEWEDRLVKVEKKERTSVFYG